MVDITHKSSTLREAIAMAEVKVSKQTTIDAVLNRKVPKGDVFEFSRAAGLLACKKTYEVIPDCHPLPVEYAAITYEVKDLSILISVEVHTIYKTGVEVEAMHAASITALTIYDMLKPIDDQVEIHSIKLVNKKGGKSDIKYAYPDSLKVAVVTISDSVVKGMQEDLSGNLVEEKLRKHKLANIFRDHVADEAEQIRLKVEALIAQQYELIVCTGGTGLSKRDVTPEALKPLIDREVPGVMEAARNYGQDRTPYAMLSRGVAGFSADSLIIALPGSPRGVEESMDAIFPYILHVFRVKDGVRHQ